MLTSLLQMLLQMLLLRRNKPGSNIMETYWRMLW
jgi:hypothetical protein